MRWLIDGMNVIGTRPDAWWRDRHAAMVRLVYLLENWAAASGEDVQAIRQAVSDLQVAAQAMAQHMHRPAGEGPAPETGGGGETKDKEDVIDAEFEVKK